jgi:hypothetical protein
MRESMKNKSVKRRECVKNKDMRRREKNVAGKGRKDIMNIRRTCRLKTISFYSIC